MDLVAEIGLSEADASPATVRPKNPKKSDIVFWAISLTVACVWAISLFFIALYTHTPCDITLRGARACWVLVDACNPMAYGMANSLPQVRHAQGRIATALGLQVSATALSVGGARLDNLDVALADAGIVDGAEVEVRLLSWSARLLRWAGTIATLSEG